MSLNPLTIRIQKSLYSPNPLTGVSLETDIQKSTYNILMDQVIEFEYSDETEQAGISLLENEPNNDASLSLFAH